VKSRVSSFCYPRRKQQGGLLTLARQGPKLLVDLLHTPLTQATLWVRVPFELFTVGVPATQRRRQEFILH